jgi:GNAT superfamily N-acetyltransferase
MEIDLQHSDISHPDAVLCLDGYFSEIDRRFTTGFDRSRGGAAGDAAYAPPTGDFLVARMDGKAVGCGGVAFRDGGFAEIKRMWVSEGTRGHGVGYQILVGLEQVARNAGFKRVRLDSNRALTEAHALYARCGYIEIERYNDNPYADLWFEKALP